MRFPLLRAGLILALWSTAFAAKAQDAGAGERVFGQCRACHQVGETAKNGIGPHLNGLLGRKAGSVEGYNYSPANKSADLIWGEASFRDYIKNPKGKMPGTKMIYAGLKDDQRITDLVAYISQFDTTGKQAVPKP